MACDRCLGARAGQRLAVGVAAAVQQGGSTRSARPNGSTFSCSMRASVFCLTRARSASRERRMQHHVGEQIERRIELVLQRRQRDRRRVQRRACAERAPPAPRLVGDLRARCASSCPRPASPSSSTTRPARAALSAAKPASTSSVSRTIGTAWRSRQHDLHAIGQRRRARRPASGASGDVPASGRALAIGVGRRRR